MAKKRKKKHSRKDDWARVGRLVKKEYSKHHHPGHYQVDPFWCTEVLDIIEAYGLGFCDGNAIKYILRAGKKGASKADLKKAIWYLERLVGKHRRKPKKRKPKP